MTIIYLSGITLLQMGVTSQYDITTIPGGLLHHHFTLTPERRMRPSVAVCFLWRFPYPSLWQRASPVARGHPALWSPDFPPRIACAPRSDRPPRRQRHPTTRASARQGIQQVGPHTAGGRPGRPTVSSRVTGRSNCIGPWSAPCGHREPVAGVAPYGIRRRPPARPAPGHNRPIV